MFRGKIKRILSLLASAAMAVTAITGAMSVSAEEIVERGECGEKVTWTLDADGVLTISGEGKMASPEGMYSIDDYPDVYTYKAYKENIKEVVIEEGITVLGVCSFYNLPNLETVVIPSTVDDCYGTLLSNGDWDKVNYAFAECKSLKNVTLAEGMTCIGGYQFANCTSLKSVTIPSTIEKWGKFSFYQCSALENVNFTDGLKMIGAVAFAETALESVVLPSTIEIWNTTTHRDRTEYEGSSYDKGYAFANCEKLSSVTFKDGIKRIQRSAFEGCTELKKVVIPSSVTNLQYAFKNCTGLEEAYIEEGAQMEGTPGVGAYGFDQAFENCTNLKRLEIPASIEISYNNAQWCNGCSSLTDLYIHGQEYGSFPVGNNSSKIHCYYGTKTYNSLISNGVGGIRLVDIEEDIENAKIELNKAVTEAQKYAEEDYTTESYGVLKALLENADKYGKDPSIMSMEDTTAGIYAAIEGLRDKSEEPSSSDPSDSSNPSNPSDNPSNPSNNNPTNTKPTTATPKVTPPTVTTVAKPAKVKNVKVTAKKKKLNVSWKKVSGATGYEIQYATNNKFTKNKKSITVKKNKVTIKKLKAKKKYFVKVRAYKLANGNKYFGNWSKVVKKKTK